MSSHKWRVFKWVNHWVAQQAFRSFVADTWEDAMKYATDDKRDEIW